MHVLLCMHSLPFNNLSSLLATPSKKKDELCLPHSLVTSDIAKNWKKKIISAGIVKPAEPGLEMKADAEFWSVLLKYPSSSVHKHFKASSTPAAWLSLLPGTAQALAHVFRPWLSSGLVGWLLACW